MSPFCDAAALDHLAGHADEAPVLISRPDQLACIADATLDKFGRVAVLDEQGGDGGRRGAARGRAAGSARQDLRSGAKAGGRA